MKTRLRGLLLIAMALATTQGHFHAATKTDPVTVLALPEGWIYVALEGDDTFTGVFHDSVSGSLVKSELVPLPNVVAPWVKSAQHAGGRLEKATTKQIPYLAVTRTSKGCETLTISATVRPEVGSTWNLESSVCGQEAHQRVMTLFESLADDRLINTLSSLSRTTARLKDKDLQPLRVGSPWSSVSDLGAPPVVEAGREGGFVAVFPYRNARRNVSVVRLAFSRDRNLAAAPEIRY